MDLRKAMWRKSSRSAGGNGSACVEVAFVRNVVAVRDSKDPDGAVLSFAIESWQRFLTSLTER